MEGSNLESTNHNPVLGHHLKTLTDSEVEQLRQQDSRGVLSPFKQEKLEHEAAKNWDRFYKRNETRFFKDRHWTTREFQELIGGHRGKQNLLEVGCGVGNFLYPLLEDDLNLYIFACDFSPRAIDFVRENPLYDEKKVKAFVCDITKDNLLEKLDGNTVDIISLIFVLSAIHPMKFRDALDNLYKCLRPGGMILFRDYGLYDTAMLRFGPGSKLSDRFYVRQDGTRSYYFAEKELQELFENIGFRVASNSYITRQTVNKKKGVDAQRIFIQAKFVKPSS